ncbi:D-glycero-beta-D-manno-heptose 1,7-bisphosphate 7-phosphatase [Kribbella albertanoniae]|uniref:D,D-heptose 1,7-bisphosphate phosphatase n=1 Tax=Kribbella albertanoniae TaxID=1266829 RepID=A0A4R4QJH7_9ACTN|nr:HAD-IIIA family hydrolase [Kribbella albertanoniae]TDC35519.1 HAD-IIIA family hydrolase [Kribbella albertanoniae]
MTVRTRNSPLVLDCRPDLRALCPVCRADPTDATGAVFLDRDGVLVENRDDYITSVDQLVPFTGITRILTDLVRAGFGLVIVTNQSAVGRGRLTLRQTVEIHEHLVDLLARSSVPVHTLICPHAPVDGCDCRKPAAGLIRTAARRLPLSLERSVLIGDSLTDLEAARAVGVPGVLVRTGRGRGQERQLGAAPGSVTVVDDLAAAGAMILAGT